MKKQPKKARKTADFNPKLDKNEGSVAKLYYDLNGGMWVGGVGFSETFNLREHSNKKKFSLVCNISFIKWKRETRGKNISS